MIETDGLEYRSGYLSASEQEALVLELRKILAAAPWFIPLMPRTGKPFSVRMSNCGSLGWVSDREGYRYQNLHPETRRPWPAMPLPLLALWDAVTGSAPRPEACLINYYGPGTRMGSHRDADEQEFRVPVVSISLGDDAVFHVGGLTRAARKTRMVLRSGDVLLLGGKSRLAYHGIDRIKPGTSALLDEGGRINLTLRRVMPAAV